MVLALLLIFEPLLRLLITIGAVLVGVFLPLAPEVEIVEVCIVGVEFTLAF